jgi:sodium/proline symporter
MNTDFLYAFTAYLGILGAISFHFYKKAMNATEFTLGSRSLNYIATAIAAHSSDMSIWLFMGFPGSVYLFGMKQAWIPLGLITGMFLSWTFVAGRLRVATEKLQSLTLSDYFEKRFNDTTGILKAVSAIYALIFFLFYISAGLVGMGIMFESVFGIDYHIGILIGLLITVMYTLLGGFVGVAYCDLFQGLFLVSMIVFVPVYALFNLDGGINLITQTAQLKNISLSFIPDSLSELISSILLAISWGIGYFGQPHILINFMGIKDAQSVKKARAVGMTWQLFTIGSSVAIGLIGIGLFPHNLVNNELVFVQMVQTLFTPFFAGFILCAIIAAGLTTIDTQILVSASIFAQDIYKRFFNPHATSAEVLRVSKVGIVIVPLMSYMIAFTRSASVHGLVSYAWTGLGSCFGPLVLTSLYSKRVTFWGALLGMIAGGTVAATWHLTGSTVPPMIPAFSANLVLILLCSK